MSQRRLVLVRHAEAGLAPLDRNRPLTDRGGHQAEAIGGWLRQARIVPDRVLASPALRTRQTWERAVAVLGSCPEPVLDERIYDNTVDGLIEVVRETDEVTGTLVLVGHNPAVGQLAHDLDDGDGAETARQAVESGFPAGAVALFDLGMPFAMLGERRGTLVDVLVPSG